MRQNIPVEKNKNYIIDITSTGSEGEGVGKKENFTIFVPGAVLGEKAEVKIVKVSKNFAFGRLENIIEASAERREPVCPIYKRCGGCQLQHYSYEAQLKLKKQRVRDSLERIGKLKTKESDASEGEGVILHDTIGMKNPYRYRNKVQLPVGERNGQLKIGFYAPRSHEIIDMDKCHIQDETADKVTDIVRKWIKKYNIPAYNEETSAGIIRHIMVRKAFKTGQVMIVIVTNGNKLPHGEELIKLLTQNIQGLKSIIQNINSERTNVILGQNCRTLWGEDTISEYIGEFKFKISALSFFQVNPVQTQVLYNKALEYAGLSGSEVVFDAYCGTGTISLFLSKRCRKVYGVEIIPQAVENARQNALENNVDNAEFIVGESEKVIPQLIDKGIRADVVVVDPPRKGCDESLLKAISKMQPEKIVYVSCDPGTLARDLSILQELGYKALEAQPVDMFPQTAHVEVVTLLTRSKSTQ